MLEVVRKISLMLGLICLSLPLMAGSPDGRDAKTQKLTTAKTLSVTNSIVIKSEVASIFVHPIKCDADGNVYLMTQLDATTGIHKLNEKGERVATFIAGAAPDLSVAHGTYFAVTADGEVYQLADLRDKIDRVVIRYNRDGSYKSNIKLETPHGAEGWGASQISLFPSGDMLIVGSTNDPNGGVRKPFTGIFDSSGAIKREVHLSDDAELQKMAESGDPRVISPGHESMNSSVELGRAEAGDDGNVYVMRRISPAIVYAISPAGEVIRRFTVDPGPSDSSYVPFSMDIAGGRIAILFLDSQTQEELIKVTDLEGRGLATYKEPIKDGRKVLGSALACYSTNPERFTFLFTSDEGCLGFRVAE